MKGGRYLLVLRCRWWDKPILTLIQATEENGEFAASGRKWRSAIHLFVVAINIGPWHWGRHNYLGSAALLPEKGVELKPVAGRWR